MIAKIALYAILSDKRNNEYRVLSEYPDKFVEANSIIKTDIDFFSQFIDLFSQYFDFDYKYIRPIVLEPMIDKEYITIPVYCLVPYSTIPKQGHLIPAIHYAHNIPIIRKIINLS